MCADTSGVDNSALEVRFFIKVNKRGPKMPHMRSRCHEWQAYRTPKNYGQFSVNGKPRFAHRVAWLLRTGTWPKLNLLHACDNPPCVRFEHLREGTQAENMQDKVARGRDHHINSQTCAKSHPFTLDNTYVDPHGWQHCRTCRRDGESVLKVKKDKSQWER